LLVYTAAARLFVGLHGITDSTSPDYRKLAEEERQRQEAEAQQQEAERQRLASQPQLEQEAQVRLALNRQTEAQFRSYAQSQFPSDPVQVNMSEHYVRKTATGKIAGGSLLL